VGASGFGWSDDGGGAGGGGGGGVSPAIRSAARSPLEARARIAAAREGFMRPPQASYLSPVPVLNSTIVSSAPTPPAALSALSALTHAPPSGQASTPSRGAIRRVSSRRRSSGTATASPPLFASASSIRKSPRLCGTRSPEAAVLGSAHGAAVFSPRAKAR